jgi:ABC-type multidrug transport system ATPase subunit
MELVIQGLSKTYPNGVRALKNVSLNIPTGIFGLLGPNGAGKTTLMRIVATLQEPDTGQISLGEIDVLRQKQEVKRQLGYLPQEFGFYPKDTAYQLLDHFALLKGIRDRRLRLKRVEELLKTANLWDEQKRKVGTFSGGMKQRLGIAQALLGNPRLIIVDEPTAGLDPAERKRFHNLFSEVGENIIVILSTHIVEDISDLCPRAAIINEGEIVFEESTEKAISALQGRIWEKEVLKSEASVYRERYRLLSTRLLAGKTLIRIFSAQRPDDSFYSVPATMEDVYFYHLPAGGMRNGDGSADAPVTPSDRSLRGPGRDGRHV